ncbi:MAG TPA: hypothetical protein VFG21_07045 [Xanthomonadaceae bacterium]|nr:hypothetical protein [Xanthomonadaceae bacterium]
MSAIAAAQTDRDAIDRLSRLHGAGELTAAILALIAAPADAAAASAWATQTAEVATAAAIREDIDGLPAAWRLPVFDVLLVRMRLLPKAERRTLLQATRRVMAAHTPLRPIDRLHWLLMRRRLGDRPPACAMPGSQNELARLAPHTLVQIARVSAYLSRMVPDGERTAGHHWYARVMAPLIPVDAVPPCDPPDGDGFAHALDEVEALPWMLRPVLVRAWVDAALATGQRARLPAGGADALRLAAGLMDSPLPPELARHYIELDWAS